LLLVELLRFRVAAVAVRIPAIAAKITRAEPADFSHSFENRLFAAAAGNRVGFFNAHAD
jgi:hypothetical protein